MSEAAFILERDQGLRLSPDEARLKVYGVLEEMKRILFRSNRQGLPEKIPSLAKQITAIPGDEKDKQKTIADVLAGNFDCSPEKANEAAQTLLIAGKDPDSLTEEEKNIVEKKFEAIAQTPVAREASDREIHRRQVRGGSEPSTGQSPESKPPKKLREKNSWKQIKQAGRNIGGQVILLICLADLGQAFINMDYPQPISAFRAWGAGQRPELTHDLPLIGLDRFSHALANLPESPQWSRESINSYLEIETLRYSTALNASRNKQYDKNHDLIKNEAIPSFLGYGRIKANKDLDDPLNWTISQKIIGLALDKAAEDEGLVTTEQLRERLKNNGYQDKEREILVAIYDTAKGKKQEQTLSELLISYQ